MSSSIDVHRLWLLVSVIFIILNGRGNLAVAFNDRKGLGSDTKSLLVKNQESFSRLHMMRRLASTSTTKVVNVDNYGAKGDGGDDSEAFKKAWNVACSSERAAIVVPKNRIYHLKPITFSGPCKSGLTFKAMTFYECKNLRVADLIIQNAQQMHLSFQKCVNVKVLNLLVSAPEKSPNTDGIHVTGTQNILIKNCVIRTGDDCISIVSGSKNVQATDIVCGPGHGISIGSLGADKSTDYVSNVLVNRARLSGTTNGVRIKTWQGGSGYAKNIIFQNISMRNVTNPIIIDQNYCDQAEACPEQASAVQVSNVVYKNIKGTSASEVAINFDCSKSHPCRGILLQNVGLVSNSGESAKASSSNVRYTKMGDVYP
ncbi:hypothetical protein NL676_036647 [Syzygium grande]|nr:hypothetical protein NL676_036647 [Syzygium grande]